MTLDTIRRTKQHWRSRGFTVNNQIDPPGKAWAPHLHAVDEMILLLRGAIEVRIAGRPHRPKRAIVVPRGEVHSIRNVGKSQAHYFYGFKTPNKR